MYQFPITAREHAWKWPWCSWVRVSPSTEHAPRGDWAGQWGDVNGVV